jgi:hypothetical protein
MAQVQVLVRKAQPAVYETGITISKKDYQRHQDTTFKTRVILCVQAILGIICLFSFLFLIGVLLFSLKEFKWVLSPYKTFATVISIFASACIFEFIGEVRNLIEGITSDILRENGLQDDDVIPKLLVDQNPEDYLESIGQSVNQSGNSGDVLDTPINWDDPQAQPV